MLWGMFDQGEKRGNFFFLDCQSPERVLWQKDCPITSQFQRVITTHLHPSPHQRNHSSKSKLGKQVPSLVVFMYAFAAEQKPTASKGCLTFSVSLNGRHVEVEITLIVSSQTKLHNLFCLYYQNHCSSEYINLNVQYSSRLDLKIFL